MLLFRFRVFGSGDKVLFFVIDESTFNPLLDCSPLDFFSNDFATYSGPETAATEIFGILCWSVLGLGEENEMAAFSSVGVIPVVLMQRASMALNCE